MKMSSQKAKTNKLIEYLYTLFFDLLNLAFLDEWLYTWENNLPRPG